MDYLKSKGITHVLNVGELDPTGVVPKIDPASLPGQTFSSSIRLSDFLSFHLLKVIRHFHQRKPKGSSIKYVLAWGDKKYQGFCDNSIEALVPKRVTTERDDKNH